MVTLSRAAKPRGRFERGSGWMWTSTEPDTTGEEGGPEGFAAFLADLFPDLVASLGVYASSRAVAEDIAQEALAAAWQHRAQVELLSDPRAWVYRVAINRSRSVWRRALLELAHQARLRPAVDEPGEAVEDGMAVRAAVRKLPRRQREAVALRYFGDLSVEQTAEVMGCAAGTVKALTSQAMASLRARLDQELS